MNSALNKLELGQFVDRDTMRFVRDYPHPIERVWAALTVPEQVSVWWMPCSSLELRAGGTYVLNSSLGNAIFKGKIKECQPPRLIDFSGVTRFELFEHEGGCRMVLTLKRWPTGWNPVSIAGFHGWLEQLGLHLEGFDYERINQLVYVWPYVFSAYEYLIRQNVADGAKVIHRVHFRVNDASLRDEMKPVLHQVTDLLRKTPNLQVQLDGFCDDPGSSFEESLKLGKARADAVAEFLREAGIAADRLIVSSAGSSHQVVPNDCEEGRAFNRRVELRPTY